MKVGTSVAVAVYVGISVRVGLGTGVNVSVRGTVSVTGATVGAGAGTQAAVSRISEVSVRVRVRTVVYRKEAQMLAKTPINVGMTVTRMMHITKAVMPHPSHSDQRVVVLTVSAAMFMYGA